MSQPSGEPATAQPAGAPGPDPSAPLLTVVRGEPTAAELAALTVIVDALVRRASQPPAPGQLAGSRWAAKSQLMRPQLQPGPGAWRASVLPR